MSRKVKIAYGIFAGERNGRRLRRALRQAGYGITRKFGDADIIIAHSAGCFWLPPASKSQHYLLIDPPYWPGRAVGERARSRARTNFRFRTYGYPLRYWLARNLWGLYYAARDLPRTVRIVRFAAKYDLEAIVRGRNVTLVRNEHDDWLTPDLERLQTVNPQLRTVEMPGDHDHFSYHPEAYVHLLQSVYG